MSKTHKNAGRFVALAVLAISLPITLPHSNAQADQRDDFVTGSTKVCPRCNLAGLNFKRRDLTGADLSPDLKGANLHDARLVGAQLAGADFTGANLNKANPSRADLSNAKLREATLYRANLDGANSLGRTSLTP